MTFMAVRGPYCHSDQIVNRGKTRRGTQRSLCHKSACTPQSFLLEDSYQGRWPEGKQPLIDRSLKASGVRDTARVLRSSTATVLRELRKKEHIPSYFVVTS
jgi:transposase-like protein